MVGGFIFDPKLMIAFVNRDFFFIAVDKKNFEWPQEF